MARSTRRCGEEILLQVDRNLNPESYEMYRKLINVEPEGDQREFVLYTNSSVWIEEFHRVMKEEVPTHQIQVMARTDPKWSVYKSFVS